MVEGPNNAQYLFAAPPDDAVGVALGLALGALETLLDGAALDDCDGAELVALGTNDTTGDGLGAHVGDGDGDVDVGKRLKLSSQALRSVALNDAHTKRLEPQ